MWCPNDGLQEWTEHTQNYFLYSLLKNTAVHMKTGGEKKTKKTKNG